MTTTMLSSSPLAVVVAAHVLVLIQVGGAQNVTFADMKTTLSNLLDYSDRVQSLRPVAATADTVSVTLDFNVAAVMGFDEANGYVEVSGYLTMEWSAPAYPHDTSNVEELVPNNQIWKPPIILVNAVKTPDLIGSGTNSQIRVHFTTLICKWEPWIIVRAACTPDVQFYPFDKQVCTLTFASWGYTKDEMSLTTASSEWTTNFFAENGEWELEKTTSNLKVERNISLAEFSIYLNRRPIYYVINLLSPVIVLGILNVFVFLLPAESGERLGFSVTCFLAYVVLLNTIMAFLPTSAAPLSYLSYYTFVMMLFSAGMSLATIFSLRFHLKPEDATPPSFLIRIGNCLRCKHLQTRTRVVKVKPKPEKDSGVWDSHEVVTDAEEDVEQATFDEQTTYKEIGAIFDLLFFLGFLIAQLFYSITYLMPVFFNAGS